MEPIMPVSQTSIPVTEIGASTLPEEQLRRSGCYSVLAALLRDIPNSNVLQYVSDLEVDAASTGNELLVSLNMLSLAARHSSEESLRDEYHALFIGLGRGEMVPYGSWYQTGFLMEKPLGMLRADLQQLGFERSQDVHEPEDHIAALCEVMAMLIQEGASLVQQQSFFENHVGNWSGSFFDDLAKAESAVFYRSAARFGSAFMALEKKYLSLKN
jgi:TorA maturation chaperone TorD